MLLQPGRKLLHRSLLTLVDFNGVSKKKPYEFVLMNDLMLMFKLESGGVRSFRQSFDIHSLVFVLDLPETSGSSDKKQACQFRLFSALGMQTLAADSPENKQLWLDKLQEAVKACSHMHRSRTQTTNVLLDGLQAER